MSLAIIVGKLDTSSEIAPFPKANVGHAAGSGTTQNNAEK